MSSGHETAASTADYARLPCPLRPSLPPCLPVWSPPQAKIADFGLLKSENLQGMTRVTGTPGYVDPDYSYSHVVTPKSDVYR